MKPVAVLDNEKARCWVHLSCAYWTPEVSFKCLDKKEPVEGLERIDPKKFQQACCICGIRGGSCVQCGKANCTKAFHVECGRRKGFFMENVAAGKCMQDIAYKMYCRKHRPLKLMRGIEASQKRTMEEVTNFCKIVEKCEQVSSRPELNATANSTNSKTIKRKRERPFTKQDRSCLIKRIRQICQDLSRLTMIFEKSDTMESESCYKQVPTFFETSYAETLSNRSFPWNAVKFGKFSAENCYNEYLRIVADEETFKMKILKRKPKSTAKRLIPVPETCATQTLYCVCQKSYYQDMTAMIGISQ